MNIAVNTRFFLQQPEGIGNFTREVFCLLATHHPGHRFYFLFDRPYAIGLTFPQNVHPIILQPPARHPLLWKYWFDIKIPLALRKIKADVFVSPDGFCSLTASVPQCLVVHDLGFLHLPKAYQKSHLQFYRRFTPRFVKKAKTLVTVSEFSKADIIKQYSVAPEKIFVCYNGVRAEFAPTGFDQQVAAMDKYAGGKAYFLCIGAIHPRKNLVNLLKGFSLFKKRLKTESKLVLAGRMAWKNAAFVELLSTYKYRDDVVLTGYVAGAEMPELVGGAYALVYPSLFEGFGVPVLEAMKSGVPVLTSAGTPMQEIAGDAALYFDPNNVADIGDKLMRIYKDENERKKLIEKGKTVAENYTWQRTANIVWQAIEGAVAKS
jgi:glycosyltransferase involved in cell wall biosynthesis